jgi:hypothetical protein
LIDIGIFNEDRYFDLFVEYAKAGALKPREETRCGWSTSLGPDNDLSTDTRATKAVAGVKQHSIEGQ